MGYECFFAVEGKLKFIAEITDDTNETNFFFLYRPNHNYIIKKLS
jgi:hypothetical protein